MCFWALPILLTFAFMHHLYLVCILFGMPSLHFFTLIFYFLVRFYHRGLPHGLSSACSHPTTSGTKSSDRVTYAGRGSFRKIVKRGLKLTVKKLGASLVLLSHLFTSSKGGARFWQVKRCVCTMLNGSYTCTVSHFHFQSI